MSELHPFTVSKQEHRYYFAHLYPHLSKLERLSKEMKVKYRGRRQFESIADMVFSILIRRKFRNSGQLYEGLSDVIDSGMGILNLSLRHSQVDIHACLCFYPDRDHGSDQSHASLDPVKVYD